MVSKANTQTVEEGTGRYRSGMEQKALVCSLWPSDSYSAYLNLFKQKVGRQRECLGRIIFYSSGNNELCK